MHARTIPPVALAWWCCLVSAPAATVQHRYYAHPAVHDQFGVIAPWYAGQNGQCDLRVRVAAETLKRYPWTTKADAASEAPHYVFSGHWQIAPDGAIKPLGINDWDNGDLGQRAAYVLSGLVDYYRYSGDPAAIAHLTYQADALLDHCLTGPAHPWPRFLISVPTKGKAYQQCDPGGMIQLDIVAEAGLGLLRAYQLTGNARWFEACKHWGDLFARHCVREPGEPPWGRYANPEAAPWKDNKQTGGVVFILYFLDELVRLGYTGRDHQIVAARDAGRAYLRDVLLPQWTVNDVWGRNYWDWADPVQAENVTEFAARYMMDNKQHFPNWRHDARNILSLFINHTGVCPPGRGDVYSGAWAFPESNSCCGRSLWYGPMELAVPFAQYGVEAQSAWAKELARRMQILATYDVHPTGVSEDNIDGGFIVCGAWFKIAHPMALKHVLGTMAWLPEEFGASRENHILRSSSVVSNVLYGKGAIAYTTFDAPPGAVDVLRLAFSPKAITADGRPLWPRADLEQNGFTIKPLPDGDTIVSIRHDGATKIVLVGDDPQQVADDDRLMYTGPWTVAADHGAFGGGERAAQEKDAAATFTFRGNQVRLIGRAAPDGGLADVYLDGVKQLVGIDCWNPQSRPQHVLSYHNGLANAEHTLKILARGEKNPRSAGCKVYVDGVQWSSSEGKAAFGEGGGPTEVQRMIFGYTGREDYQDAQGNLWRPATEWVVRSGAGTDSVAAAWWTQPARTPIDGATDPELYRYGAHAKEFWANVTVGPGTYYVRLKLAATRGWDPATNCVSVALNGQPVVNKMDVCATAGGPNRAVDLVFNDVAPQNGTIEVRFTGGDPAQGIAGEAFVQAIEVGPGSTSPGATPVTMLGRNLLRNPGFEAWQTPPQAAPVPANWQFAADTPSATRLLRESACAATETEPAPLPEGSDAARIAGKGHSRLFQEVAVRPGATYRAAALVRARDTTGKDLRPSAPTSASMILEELDAQGGVLVTHRELCSRSRQTSGGGDRGDAPPNSGKLGYVATRVTTSPRAARLRFVLDTTLGGDAGTGSVTYDQCLLDGPPAAAAVVGKITSEAGRPLEGALVTVAGRPVRAGPDGAFALAGLSDLMTVPVQGAKQGYYPLARVLTLEAGENRCDLALPAMPTNNLLANGDFEQGFPPARSVEHGAEGDRGPWRFQFSPNVACYIYPESIYTWRKPRVFRGKEAISHVTDGGGQVRLSQDVVVDPNTPLLASAWVLGLDVHGSGKGFGAGAKDFAGLALEELDAQGQVVASHEPTGIRKATADFQRVRCRFTTGPKTAKVRFTLLSAIECIWQQGAAIYDDCALEPVRP